MKILPRHKKFLKSLRFSYDENKLTPKELEFLSDRFLNEVKLQNVDDETLASSGNTFWGGMVESVKRAIGKNKKI